MKQITERLRKFSEHRRARFVGMKYRNANSETKCLHEISKRSPFVWVPGYLSTGRTFTLTASLPTTK